MNDHLRAHVGVCGFAEGLRFLPQAVPYSLFDIFIRVPY
jgi:hypothetical protein